MRASNQIDDKEQYAREFIGNWKKDRDFGWHDQPEDAEEWGLYHLDNRDSSILDKSNADVIRETLEQYDEDEVQLQHFNHWAVGWIDAVAVRVYENDNHEEFTDAFDELYDIRQKLSDYPILDEEDVSKQEHEATLENIQNEAPMVVEDAPEDWPGKVFGILSDSGQLSQADDGSQWAECEDVAKALHKLGFLHPDEFEGYDLDPADVPEPEIAGQQRLFNPSKLTQGMHQGSILESKEDMQWLFDAHGLPLAKQGYKVAILYGNDDAPDAIELYARDDYKCVPTVLLPDEDGESYVVAEWGEACQKQR